MPTRRIQLPRVGKLPTTAVRRLIFSLSRSWGLVLQIPRPVGLGEGEEDEQIGLGLDGQLHDRWKGGDQAIGHPTQPLGAACSSGCSKLLRMAEATIACGRCVAP